MKFQGTIMTGSSIIANIDNTSYVVQQSHPNYVKLREALKQNDADEFVSLFSVEDMVKTCMQNACTEEDFGRVTVENGEVYYDGEPVDNVIVDVIKNMVSEGFNFRPMMLFLENLMNNPSKRSVDELYKFLTAMGLVITEDGCFLAYKSVRNDYMDKYSGTIDNTPGANGVKRLARNSVDDNCNNCCSHGYHVGALDYAGPGGTYNNSTDKVVICKVNPADVVSVPIDYSFQKLRCCYYEVVGDFVGKLTRRVYTGKAGDNVPMKTESKKIREEIEPENLLMGEYYTGKYTDKSGITKQRYFMVETQEFEDESVLVELLDPEENSGHYRTFRWEGLSDVYEYDPDDEKWIDEDDDCGDQCDYCGEYNCLGDCEDEDDEDDYNGHSCGNQSYW